MIIESIEEQDFGAILKKFNITKGTSDSDRDLSQIEYYYNKSTTPTVLLRKLVKDLDKNENIFEINTKINYIGDVANLINEIRDSHIEHLTSINVRTFKEIKLN